MENETIAMQERCVHCGQEQYRAAVYDISMGEHPCVWCGKKSKKMTNEEYLKVMRERRKL